tara:strand:- start:1301 stop:1651 length:351 start_codon:yes stop_codon:yes gene_type:complete
MDIDSPLRYLDSDVSQYLYETYFPSELTRRKKKELNEEYTDKVITYLKRYQITNLYENEVMFCIRGSLYKKIPFLSHINSDHKHKIRKNKKLMPAQYRAIQYKEETIKFKKIITKF